MGRPIRRRAGRDHGGDQRLHRLRPQAGRPGHRRLPRPCRHARPTGGGRGGRRRGHRQGSEPSQGRNRGRSLRLLAQARGHPYECREPPGRDRRARRGPPSHGAIAQRSGRRRLPPVGARHHRRARPSDRRPAEGAGVTGARDRRHGDARVHPPPIGPARHLRPSPARLCRDARARRRPFPRRAPAPQ